MVILVTNMGAYTLLKYDGSIFFYLSQFRQGFPSDNTNFKNIYSNFTLFFLIFIKNNNDAVI